MTLLKALAFSTLAVAGVATAADAALIGVPATTRPAIQATPVGYGPVHNGLYGGRTRFHARRSYGTGYHGRGSKTGGPAGGLPNRN